MSARELSQLSLPQIASAVAAGELGLEEVEAELRRRPLEAPREQRKRRTPPPRPRREELGQLLEETRRELRQTARRLTQLGRRLDVLTQLVGEDEAPPLEEAA